MCRKVSPETSTGIRPILLDLQGVPRDQDVRTNEKTTLEERLQTFLGQLGHLTRIGETNASFVTERKGDLDIPSSIVKSCCKFDAEMWKAQCLDWLELVKAQHKLVSKFDDLAEQLRANEIEMSIRSSPKATIALVKQRVEMLLADRQKRFEVCKDMVEEVTEREMNLSVNLVSPSQKIVLELPKTSVLGMFGMPLKMAGEPLPIG